MARCMCLSFNPERRCLFCADYVNDVGEVKCHLQSMPMLLRGMCDSASIDCMSENGNNGSGQNIKNSNLCNKTVPREKLQSDQNRNL